MVRSEPFDWRLHYQAVLVATAILAIRNAPVRTTTHHRSANGRAWQGAPFDARGWRAVAIAAGAVPRV
ncbi:MAG: hypothetical protein ACRES3_11215 [Steroidobacteraceae bacterium]